MSKSMNELRDEETCPDSGDLFTLATNASRLTESETDALKHHLLQCPLCAEEYQELEDRMEEEMIEPVGEFSDIPVSISEKLRDLALHYPSPSVRVFSLERTRSCWEKLRRRWERLLEYPSFDVSTIGLSLVRSVTKEFPVDDHIVTTLKKAQEAISVSEYEKAGDIYSSASESLEGLSMEREVRFCAGYAYLLGGFPDRAVAQFTRGIDEETPAAIYWLLALSLFESGGFEGAYRSLQVVEGLDTEISHEAGRILDRIDLE